LLVVVAAVHAVAADAVLVAHHLPKLGAHLATALARLSMRDLARRSCLEAGSTREKSVGEAEKPKELCVAVWQGKHEIPVARSCEPNERIKWFYHFNLSSSGRRVKCAGSGRVRSRNI
jgi:hypothetical protein